MMTTSAPAISAVPHGIRHGTAHGMRQRYSAAVSLLGIAWASAAASGCGMRQGISTASAPDIRLRCPRQARRGSGRRVGTPAAPHRPRQAPQRIRGLQGAYPQVSAEDPRAAGALPVTHCDGGDLR